VFPALLDEVAWVKFWNCIARTREMLKISWIASAFAFVYINDLILSKQKLKLKVSSPPKL
jgi:hypothetical protein